MPDCQTVASATLEGVQAQLQEGAGLLEWVQWNFEEESGEFTPHYGIFLLTAEGLQAWLDLGEAAAINQQIDQLRRDLEKRESELCKAHTDYDTTQSELKGTEDRVADLVQKVGTEKQRGVALADEIKQLGQIIADCDAEEAKQQMKFNSVTNERNILATQLIRRNEELDLLPGARRRAGGDIQ